MMLVYFKGKGVWFDFPSVDSPKRNNAYRKWVAENIPDTSEGDCNEDDWEKFSTKLAEWNKSNPPPKYKVVEDEISLEIERFFDFSKPELSYQPEEADVFALFKLKAKDERQLRYEEEVTVSRLLPCDHPDGDRGGFFFQLDVPHTFTRKDVFLDVPDKPTNRETIESKVVAINSDLGYVDVFFKGYGCWTTDIYLIEESSGELTIHIPIGKQLDESSACGVFVLGHTDTIAYKHSNSLDGVCTLFPCATHSNRAFPPEIDWSRIQTKGLKESDFSVEVSFSIDRKRPERPIIAKPDNPTNSLTIESDGVVSQETTKPIRTKIIQTKDVEDVGARSKKEKRLKGESDRLRTAHFIEWASRTGYDGSQTHYYLQAVLRGDKSDLWGKNETTFNKWIQTDEAIAARELLHKLKLQARQAV